MSRCHLCGGGGLCPLCDGSGRDMLPNAETFGHLVLDMIAQRGLTQARVARSMGTIPSSLSRMINGRRPARKETVSRLAKALGMDEHEEEMLLLAAGHASDRTTTLARAYLAGGNGS